MLSGCVVLFVRCHCKNNYERVSGGRPTAGRPGCFAGPEALTTPEFNQIQLTRTIQPDEWEEMRTHGAGRSEKGLGVYCMEGDKE